MIFNAETSDSIAGYSGGGDLDVITEVIGPGASGGVDVGKGGSVSVRGQGSIGLGEAATINVCDTKKWICRR